MVWPLGVLTIEVQNASTVVFIDKVRTRSLVLTGARWTFVDISFAIQTCKRKRVIITCLMHCSFKYFDICHYNVFGPWECITARGSLAIGPHGMSMTEVINQKQSLFIAINIMTLSPFTSNGGYMLKTYVFWYIEFHHSKRIWSTWNAWKKPDLHFTVYNFLEHIDNSCAGRTVSFSKIQMWSHHIHYW